MRAFLQVWIAVQRLNGNAHRSLPLGACVRVCALAAHMALAHVPPHSRRRAHRLALRPTHV